MLVQPSSEYISIQYYIINKLLQNRVIMLEKLLSVTMGFRWLEERKESFSFNFTFATADHESYNFQTVDIDNIIFDQGCFTWSEISTRQFVHDIKKPTYRQLSLLIWFVLWCFLNESNPWLPLFEECLEIIYRDSVVRVETFGCHKFIKVLVKINQLNVWQGLSCYPPELFMCVEILPLVA